MALSDEIFCNLIANRIDTDLPHPVLTIEGAGVRDDEVRSYR